jgi:hypothetical protein
MGDVTEYPVPDAAAEIKWMDFTEKARMALGDRPETERLIDAVFGIRPALDNDTVWVDLLEGMRATLEEARSQP